MENKVRSRGGKDRSDRDKDDRGDRKERDRDTTEDRVRRDPADRDRDRRVKDIERETERDRGRRDRDRDRDRVRRDPRGGGGSNDFPTEEVEEPRSNHMATRISQLIRTIAKVESKDSFGEAVRTIGYKLDENENRRYVTRAFPILANSLADVFTGLASVGLTWSEYGIEQLTILLIKLNTAMRRQEGTAPMKIASWLIDLIIKKSRVPPREGRPRHVYVMFKVFIRILQGYNEQEICRLPAILLSGLDKVDTSVAFQILSSIFGKCLERDESSNQNFHFPDFVDLLIGWMVDEEGRDDNTVFCSGLLFLMRKQFLKDRAFPMTVVKQIVDDMWSEATPEKLCATNDKFPSVVKRIVLLTKAYSAVIKVDCIDEKGFVNDCTERVLECSLLVLQKVKTTEIMKQTIEDLLFAANEAISVSPGASGPCSTIIIKTEIEFLLRGKTLARLDYLGFLKKVESICVWVEGAVSGTQLSDDTLSVAAMVMSLIDKMGEQRERTLLVQTLLRTRHVPLLQKVYSWLLSKLDVDNQLSVLFVVSCLSDLASKSGSILSLYALVPSLFDLLTNLASTLTDLNTKKAVIRLLRCHCTVHSHWISTLSFTTNLEFSSESPGARCLPMIVNFWISELSDADIHSSDKHWILEWILEFLSISSAYAEGLYKMNPIFFGQILSFVCFGVTDPTYSTHTPCFSQEQTHRTNTLTFVNQENKPPTTSMPFLFPDAKRQMPKIPPQTVNAPVVGRSGEPWQFLTEAQQLFELLWDDNSSYFLVRGLQSDFTSYCVNNLLNKKYGVRIPPEIIKLMVEALKRLPPLVVTEKRLPPSERMEHFLEFTCKSNLPGEDFLRMLSPTEFNKILYNLLFDGDGGGSDADCNLPQPGVIPVPRSNRKVESKEEISMAFQLSPVQGDVGISNPPALIGKTKHRTFVEYIIKTKLRTALGKPQDLFGQILASFKSSNVPEWKLDFIFFLEQAFVFWSGGSNMIAYESHAECRAFFAMNKSPCFEWLKKIRKDLIEAASKIHSHFHVMYQSAKDGDGPRAELAMFHIKDKYGINGRGKCQKAAWLYINGHYEDAIKLLNDPSTASEDNEELKSLITDRAAKILSFDITQLPSDPSLSIAEKERTLPLSFLLPETIENYSILDLQLKFLNKSTEADLRHHRKEYIDFNAEIKEEFDHSTLIKICSILPSLPKIQFYEKCHVWIALGTKMLENNNLEWTERLLTKLGLQWDNVVNEDSEGLIDSFNQCFMDSVHFKDYSHKMLNLAAQFLFKRQQLSHSAFLYSELLSTCFHATGENELTSVAKISLITEVTRKFKDFPSSLIEIMRKSGVMDTQEVPWVDPDMQYCSLATEKEALRTFLIKMLDLFPTEKELWGQLGDLFYEMAQAPFTMDCANTPNLSEKMKSSEGLKQSSFESYCNHLRYSSVVPSSYITRHAEDLSLVTVISRVVSLISNGAVFRCDPQEIFKSDRWLDFLPQIAITPSLREYILKQFPDESSMYLCCHDTSMGVSLSVSALERRGIFDCLSYTYADVNEDGYSHSSFLSHCPSCSQQPSTFKKNGCSDNAYFPRSPLQITEPIKTFAKELLRLSSTAEEVWSWNLQRVISDWNKRMSVLKKDTSRTSSHFMIKEYISPIATFLQQLWLTTLQSPESAAHLNFLVKNCDKIPALLHSLDNCQSMEHMQETFDSLLTLSENLESSIATRSQLADISPGLHSFKEWGTGITLPGIPSSITIASIDPVILALATKTKPKKIRFLGSNGKYYEYLLKGNENLSVDAGVMQFFSVSRTIIKQPLWTYAVTPLGNRGGLIQMVQNAVPAYQLYKKYLLKRFPGLKTSEVFWKKMAEFGIHEKKRHAVDPHVLKQVFVALQSESPKDLFSRELLLYSANTQSWSRSRSNFTRDSGVSCAVSYLLGIGDRHLDNILVNLMDGKLIHVDFSLVFDRGEKLRIPECVPFRLTQNFAEAIHINSFMNFMEDALTLIQRNAELARFCANSIAFGSQIEENFMIDSNALRASEVNVAIMILKSRYEVLFPILQQQKNQVVATTESLEKLSTSYLEMFEKVQHHGQVIERLTATMGELKVAQYDPVKMEDLRARVSHFGNCIAANPHLIPGPIDSVESVIYTLCTRLTGRDEEGSRKWANELEALIATDLQREIKQKFEASDNLSYLEQKKMEAVATLGRKLNKWRRLLANFDPAITYISKEVKLDSRYGSFKALVEDKWNPEVSHFWLHCSAESLIGRQTEFLAQIDLSEVILEEVFYSLSSATDSPAVEGELNPVQFNMELVDNPQAKYLMKKFNSKLTGFNINTSVETLIAAATSASNLSKMFEGWTPWI